MSRPPAGLAPLLPVAPGYGFRPERTPYFRAPNDIFSDGHARTKLWAPPLFLDASMPPAGKLIPRNINFSPIG